MQDTAAVLATAAIFDFRTVGETDIMAWHKIVGDLDAEEALAAVFRWYRDRSDRLMPAHLREAIRLVRDDRRKAARIAEAEAAAEQATPPAQEPVRRRWSELGTEERERVTGLSRGLLGAQVIRERFPSVSEMEGERFVPPKLWLDTRPVYGGD